MSMSEWAWEKVERRFKRHIIKAEAAIQRLAQLNDPNQRGAFGAELGIIPTTPCVEVDDATERRKRRKAAMPKRPIKGAHACHRCDNPKCVAADHLFWGTPGDNARDCYLKGRHHSQRDARPVEERIATLRAKIFLWKLQIESKSLIDASDYDDSSTLIDSLDLVDPGTPSGLG